MNDNRHPHCASRHERPKRGTGRATMERLYGHVSETGRCTIDIDKVWEDRDALHDATRSMTSTPRKITWPLTGERNHDF